MNKMKKHRNMETKHIKKMAIIIIIIIIIK